MTMILALMALTPHLFAPSLTFTAPPEWKTMPTSSSAASEKAFEAFLASVKFQP